MSVRTSGSRKSPTTGYNRAACSVPAIVEWTSVLRMDAYSEFEAVKWTGSITCGSAPRECTGDYEAYCRILRDK
ncbi:hypothetical protein [Methanosarcina sp. UBA5]|uniref:hypothetical protein n=1 Tax=Methanosarcina sp. UBA5 TaxID=1915593 RepID=UPI0025F80A80|nr:hypothetical protein [Methanosarcina sp. UBA5]